MSHQKRFNLERRRKKIGFSHQEIADLAKISRAYYTNIETGRKNPSLEVAKRIADALHSDMDIFFQRSVSFRDKNNTQQGLDSTETQAV
ncbi:helix-turn-helix transcriptional regulator [Melghirimyces algeriensis]|uniref:Helix-turn-helix n=1 Tax=Melghirimyces algeriensis TaxID=910412 RepID=A0A521C4P4_9BACL|nr:helix-turn-helix transcriptional regulator [Melghirimyces algeriensis]SMO54315.1 Helix-turn-helix [Melghirimyces algeriensis]